MKKTLLKGTVLVATALTLGATVTPVFAEDASSSTATSEAKKEAVELKDGANKGNHTAFIVVTINPAETSPIEIFLP